eukprot:11087170-Karenia_brevis.AAC.1
MQAHAEFLKDVPDIPFATCWSRGVESMHGFQIWQVKPAACEHFAESVRRSALDADAGFLSATCLEPVPFSTVTSTDFRVFNIGKLIKGPREQPPVLPKTLPITAQ